MVAHRPVEEDCHSPSHTTLRIQVREAVEQALHIMDGEGVEGHVGIGQEKMPGARLVELDRPRREADTSTQKLLAGIEHRYFDDFWAVMGFEKGKGLVQIFPLCTRPGLKVEVVRDDAGKLPGAGGLEGGFCVGDLLRAQDCSLRLLAGRGALTFLLKVRHFHQRLGLRLEVLSDPRAVRHRARQLPSDQPGRIRKLRYLKAIL